MLGMLLKLGKVFIAGVLAGALATLSVVLVLFFLTRSAPAAGPSLPDSATLVEKVREVAKLETLEVRAHKTVSFEVPPPPNDSVIASLKTWAKYSTKPPVGRAMVFADVHVGLDLSRLDADSIVVEGDTVTVTLPPLMHHVSLRPGETEVITSNLDSAGTAQLLDEAKWKIEADVRNDAALSTRARESAERAIAGLLHSVGFRKVRFTNVDPVLSFSGAGSRTQFLSFFAT